MSEFGGTFIYTVMLFSRMDVSVVGGRTYHNISLTSKTELIIHKTIDKTKLDTCDVTRVEIIGVAGFDDKVKLCRLTPRFGEFESACSVVTLYPAYKRYEF